MLIHYKINWMCEEQCWTNEKLINIGELYDQLTTSKQVFPNFVLMVDGAMTTSLRSVISQRSF
jgi:hypothetical protein